MNAIVPFNFGEEPVRIEDRGGAPWFVLTDVCRVLGMSNPSVAARRLDDDERDDLNISDPIGRSQSTTVINEAGLYRLILTSRKDAAKRFSKWVTSEVLPTIRRTGGYGMTAAPNLDDNATLRALLLGKIDRLDELEPKEEAFDRIADARGALTLTQAAKVLKVGRDESIRFMRKEKWIYRAANGRLLGYRSIEQSGLIDHRVSRLAQHDGPDKVVASALLTGKGVTRLATMLAERRT